MHFWDVVRFTNVCSWEGGEGGMEGGEGAKKSASCSRCICIEERRRPSVDTMDVVCVCVRERKEKKRRQTKR